MNFKKRFAIILAIAGTATLVIHIINRVITLTSTMNNNLDTTEGTYYPWRFGNIFYTIKGEGSPILLMHDIESCGSNHEWNKIINNLSKTNKVYAIDMLGCGRSDKPNITYTNFLFVQMINDFVKDIVKTPVSIVASGTTSSIAIMSALNNHDTIDKILLINPCEISTLATAPTVRTKILKHVINTPIIGTLLYNILNNKKKIEDKFISTYLTNPDLIDNDDVNKYHEAAHLGGMNAKYLQASIEGGYLNTNIIHALTSLNTSIFIITSNKYSQIAENYKYYMPSIEVVEVEGTQLCPHLEVPDEILEQINYLFDIKEEV